MAVDLVSVQDLIENVRTLMGSDTATLLLLDEAGGVLEPAASAGLGRRWRGAPHVRMGAGFAGRVAEAGRPVFVNEVNEVSVLNPILREAGVQRLLGVPVFGRTACSGSCTSGASNRGRSPTVTPSGWRREQRRSGTGCPSGPRETPTSPR